jgi:Na+/H+ antiporter NhaD/arsenite permease-like protein
VQTVNVLLTVILVGVVVYILFRPTNNTAAIIHALGGSSAVLAKTLSGQYAGGSY